MKNRNTTILLAVRKLTSLLIIPYLFFSSACDYDSTPSFENIESVQGFKPIYKPYLEIQEIKAESPKPLINPGKIYIYKDFLFVNESGKGVHVINNINPASPKPYAFISIEGNVDISIKGDVLFADNYADLVTLDISDVENITLLGRIKDVFENKSFLPLPRTGVYFECPDNSKGVIIGWEEVILKNPKCYR